MPQSSFYFLILKFTMIINLYMRAFSLMWPAFMLVYWNKRTFLHKKRFQVPQD